LVVSWNEAAEIKLSVDNAACVIPNNTGIKVPGFDFLNLIVDKTIRIKLLCRDFLDHG
jgi:hypothetical protein